MPPALEGGGGIGGKEGRDSLDCQNAAGFFFAFFNETISKFTVCSCMHVLPIEIFISKNTSLDCSLSLKLGPVVESLLWKWKW